MWKYLSATGIHTEGSVATPPPRPGAVGLQTPSKDRTQTHTHMEIFRLELNNFPTSNVLIFLPFLVIINWGKDKKPPSLAKKNNMQFESGSSHCVYNPEKKNQG